MYIDKHEYTVDDVVNPFSKTEYCDAVKLTQGLTWA